MENLKELINSYALNKNELDSYKDLCDKQNKEIKSVMTENNLTSFDTDIYTAKIGTQERTKFDEDTAIMILQNLYLTNGISKEMLSKIVIQKPCIDMNALENAIYHGNLDASILAPANSVTTVMTLKVAAKKEK